MDGWTALHHAISEGHADAAIELLKAGAEPDKRDSTDSLAIDLAPDAKVIHTHPSSPCPVSFLLFHVISLPY